MKRIYLFCGVGCMVALFAVTAFSQGSKPASPCCESAQDAKATPCCCQAAAQVKKDTSCCASSATCCCSVTVKATMSKQQNVYELLEKLEALKAKQDALESEIRETRALLNEKFRTLQERVGKANRTPHGSPYAPAVTPVTSYEPVTSYRVVLVKNPKTGETQRVVEAVTSYVSRESVPTVATYGVPQNTPSNCVPAQTGPAPCVLGTVVPTQPVSSPVPPQPVHDLACPVTPSTDTIPAVTPESRPRPVKATKTDRPVPIKPATETRPVSPKDEDDIKPQPPKTPPTATPSPK